jgi:hypothetical protein
LSVKLSASETKLARVNDEAIRRVLEAAGVEFIDDNGGGPSGCGALNSSAAEMCGAQGLWAGRKILKNAQSVSSSRCPSIVTVVARQPPGGERL